MSTQDTSLALIPTAKMGLPANIAAMMDNLMDAASGGISGGGSVNRISIKNGRFRLMVAGQEVGMRNEPYLDVVVVGVNPHISKTYYAQAYDPKAEPAAPDCSSNDGIGPDAGVRSPQSDLCITCPQNVWGSKINPQTGAKIKACADYKRLAVAIDGELDGDLYQLQVPGGSLKAWKGWVDTVKVNKSNLLAVTTRVDATDQSLKFGKGRVLDVQEIKGVISAAMSDDVQALLNNNAATLDGVGSTDTPAGKPAEQDIPVFTAPVKAPAAPAPRSRKPAQAAQPAAQELLPPETEEELQAGDPLAHKLESQFADFAKATWDHL
jgi:hypothetical protein